MTPCMIRAGSSRVATVTHSGDFGRERAAPDASVALGEAHYGVAGGASKLGRTRRESNHPTVPRDGLCTASCAQRRTVESTGNQLVRVGRPIEDEGIRARAPVVGYEGVAVRGE